MKITLSHGAGGKEMEDLISGFGFNNRGKWKNCDNDSANLDLGDRQLVFTTDSFTVDPVFFPGADIGHLAFCGTVNDLVVMGAEPVGISLGVVIEEGFSIKDLDRIMKSVRELSEKTAVPIVTGDTKVMDKGKLDKIMINTSGVGLAQSVLETEIVPGDKVILSGSLGEHAVALLSKRFDYETSIESDSKPLIDELNAVKGMIKVAKDITRGGLAAVLSEIIERDKMGMLLNEEYIEVKDEVNQVCEMLGLNVFDLACEGKFVCVTAPSLASSVQNALLKFDKDAVIIGEVTNAGRIVMQTVLGRRILPKPQGRIVPRIC